MVVVVEDGYVIVARAGMRSSSGRVVVFVFVWMSAAVVVERETRPLVVAVSSKCQAVLCCARFRGSGQGLAMPDRLAIARSMSSTGMCTVNGVVKGTPYIRPQWNSWDLAGGWSFDISGSLRGISHRSRWEDRRLA